MIPFNSDTFGIHRNGFNNEESDISSFIVWLKSQGSSAILGSIHIPPNRCGNWFGLKDRRVLNPVSVVRTGFLGFKTRCARLKIDDYMIEDFGCKYSIWSFASEGLNTSLIM